MSCHRLENKVALVTASTAGIGYAIAKRLAEEGASVVISSRKANNVSEAVKSLQSEGLKVDGIACHVGDVQQLQSLVDFTVQKHGRVDILVSNAVSQREAVSKSSLHYLKRYFIFLYDHRRSTPQVGQ